MEITEVIGAGVAVVCAAGGGAWGLIKWIDGKLGEKAQSTEVDALWKENEKRERIDEKLFEYHKEHEEKDNDRFERMEKSNRDRHDEMMAVIGDVRTDIAGIKR
jgi:hypothetical protein